MFAKINWIGSSKIYIKEDVRTIFGKFRGELERTESLTYREFAMMQAVKEELCAIGDRLRALEEAAQAKKGVKRAKAK